MSGISLLILIISIGYLYNAYHPEKKIALYRTEGQHLYFTAASTGLILYGIACLILFTICFINSDSDEKIKAIISKIFDTKTNYVFNIFILTIFSVIEALIAISYFVIIKKINNLSPEKMSLELSLLDQYPIEKLLFISANDKNNENRLIMITLSDKKVYIGMVEPNMNLLKNLSENDSIFKFIPFYSGYRNKDTLDVELTTNYANRIQYSNEDDLSILLDRNTITSIAPIDHKQFIKFVLNKTDKLDREILKSITSNLVVLIILKNKRIFMGKFSKKNDLDLITIRHHKNLLFQTMLIGDISSDTNIKLSSFSDEFNSHSENDLITTIKKDDIEHIILADEINTLAKMKTKLNDKKFLTK
ncbi:hypothetical protein [Acinetobacter seifertii]|uniref:hypothetical protein n=1 Tax=Acinetobacter seifertii TaxID=1530123 RepID=UPI0032B52FCA